MNGHARIMPSALHLTVPCPRSLTLQESVPPCPETEDELEGQVAHEVACFVAKGNRRAPGTYLVHKGRKWEVDQDMIDGAELYASEACFHSTARYEDAVSIPDIHPECWGTPDYWRYMPEANLLKVIDYKYGHRFVDAFENWQLIAYALGVARRLELPDSVNVKLVIVQPRCFNAEPVREWETSVGALRTFIEYLNIIALSAVGPNADAVTGEHCRDCKARHVCSLLQQNAASLADFSGRAEPALLTTPAAMGAEARILHDAIKRLEARYDGLKASLESLARGGANVPYWHMQPGRAPLKWDVPVSDVIDMGRAMGVDLSKPAAVVTPTQATKLGIDEAVTLAYASRPTPALHLKPDDTNALRKIFNRGTHDNP